MEQRRGPQTKSPDSSVPKWAGTQQAQGAAKWDVSLVWEGKCARVGWGQEGSLGTEARGKLLPIGTIGALQRLVCCVVCGREGAGGDGGPEAVSVGLGEGAGGGSGVKLSSPRRKLLLGEEAGGTGGHCSSSEDSCEMPSSSSFSSFLGLPLGFLPGAVVVFRVLAAPLFLLPFGRPRGLLGVGTSLGSFGGCLRGLPRPRFSVPSFSCLEAKGWLDFELDSLIFLLYGADEEQWLGCASSAAGLRCALRAAGSDGAGR